MTAVLVRVERRHIERGKEASPTGLGLLDPMELAIQGAFDDDVRADVDGGRDAMFVTIGAGEDGTLVLDLPSIAEQWVRDYDAGQPMDPIEFELDLPSWLADAVRRAQTA